MKGKKLRIITKDEKFLDIPLTLIKKMLFFGDVFLKLKTNKDKKVLLVIENNNKIIYTKKNKKE